MASDGGVFPFGNALFLSGLGNTTIKPDSPIVGMALDSDGGGYLMSVLMGECLVSALVSTARASAFLRAY